MSEAKTFETVEEYAGYIQAQTNTILSRLCFGHTEEAGELIAALCTGAARIVQGAKMKQERAGMETLDLSTLPKPKDVTPEEDVESPFYRE